MEHRIQMNNIIEEKASCSNDDEIKKMFRNKLEIVLKIDNTNVNGNKEYDVSNWATTIHDPESVSIQPKNIAQYTLDDEDSPNKVQGTVGGKENLRSYRGSRLDDKEHNGNNLKTGETAGNKTDYRKWCILFGGFLSFVLVAGFPFNMSVLYVEWLNEFGKSNSETALVQSVCTGIVLIGGFFSGTVITKYGPRKCGIIGGFLSAVGLGLAFIASSIVYLVLFIGLISGSGFSLCYISASTVVGMHFKGKQKMLSLAFVSFGSGIGGSFFPVILEILISRFGWRGSLLIIAGLMLHLVAIGISYTVPLKYNSSRRNSIARRSMELLKKNSDTINESNIVTLPRYDYTADVRSKESDTNNQNEPGLKSVQSDSNIKILSSDENKLNRASLSSSEVRHRSLYESSELRRRSLYEVEENVDLNQTFLSIFKDIITNKIFMGYAFSLAISLASINATLIFFIDYFESKGIRRQDALTIYLLMNLTNSFFRLLPGFLKLAPHISVLSIPSACTFIASISMMLFTFVGSSIVLNTILACMFGIGMGGMVTVMAVSVVKLIGQTNYSAGLGISMTIVGIFNTTAGPVSGYIRDLSGDYNISFLCASVILFTASVSFFTTMVCRYYHIHDRGSRFDFELIITKKSRRTTLIPWRRKSVNLSSVHL